MLAATAGRLYGNATLFQAGMLPNQQMMSNMHAQKHQLISHLSCEPVLAGQLLQTYFLPPLVPNLHIFSSSCCQQSATQQLSAGPLP